MPIRITCPSCSATLSVKDEFAGRAVKCPKCGGVIPASQPAAPAAPPPPPPPPAPAPAAENAPFEDPDEPAEPAKSGGKIVGKPVSRAKDEDEDDRPRRKDRAADEDDKPRRRDRAADDRADDDRSSKSKKGPRDDRDRDDDDRPARRRRDDDDDDRPGRGRKKSGSGVGLILGILGLLLLGCCGAGGLGAWWLIELAKEQAQKERDRGTGTDPIEITAAALAKEERSAPQKTAEKYAGKWLIVEGTLQTYQFGVFESILLEDGVNCTAQGDALKRFFALSKGQKIKVKGKYFAGTMLSECTLEWSGPDPSIQITAENLINDYKNKALGNSKYMNKEVTITKAVIEEIPLDDVVLSSTEKTTNQMKILADNIGMRPKHFPDLSEGKTVTVKGTCKGEKNGNILIGNARFVP